MIRRFLCGWLFLMCSIITFAGVNDRKREQLDYRIHSIVIKGDSNVKDFKLTYSSGSFHPIVLKNTEKKDSSVIDIRLDSRKIQAVTKGMKNDFLTMIHAHNFPFIHILFPLDKLFSQTTAAATNNKRKLKIVLNGERQAYFYTLQNVEPTNDGYCLAGHLSICLTDFGITPPQKLFGMIRVRNQVSIQFSIEIRQVSSLN